MTKPKIVVPGGSGACGQSIATHFQDWGWDVVVLSRKPNVPSATKSVAWDGESLGCWVDELSGAQAVLNLSGRSVNCRYTEANRMAIYESRLKSTAIIGQALQVVSNPPPVWLNASTATIYRHALDHPQTDENGEIGVGTGPDADPKWKFSLDVAKKWESELFSAPLRRIRRVALRSSMVFGTQKGGVFDVLSVLVRRGLGGKQGNGLQKVSWIHESDFCRAVAWSIEHDSVDGPINVCAPNPVSNSELMAQLRKAWGVPLGLPVTKLMLELGAVLMRTETELILKSRWVVPSKLLGLGFEFQFPTIQECVTDLVLALNSARARPS